VISLRLFYCGIVTEGEIFSLSSSTQRRLASRSPYRCDLQLDDEAVRVAVGMKLGTSLWMVDVQGLHAMVCKKTPDRIAGHSSVACSLSVVLYLVYS